jgi:hypothetical protein
MAEVDKGIEYLFPRDVGFLAYGTIYKDGHFVINKTDRNNTGAYINPLQTIYEYNTNVLNIKIVRVGGYMHTSGYTRILEPYHFICILNDQQTKIIFNLLMKMYENDNFNTHSLDNITVIKLLDEYWYSEQQKSKETIDELTTKYELQIKQLQDENEILKTKSVQSSHTQSHRRTHSANRAPERQTPSRKVTNRSVSNRRTPSRSASNARRTSKGYSV